MGGWKGDIIVRLLLVLHPIDAREAGLDSIVVGLKSMYVEINRVRIEILN